MCVFYCVCVCVCVCLAHDRFACHSPCEHHHEVHDIPAVSQVGVLVEGETKSQDLYSRFKAEDPNEVRLCVILVNDEKAREITKVVRWEGLDKQKTKHSL